MIFKNSNHSSQSSIVTQILVIILFMASIGTTNAQNAFIPYRSGKLWGLADTFGALRIKPVYDTIDRVRFEYFGADTFAHTAITKKGRKFGCLVDGKEVLKPEYDKLRVYAGLIREQDYSVPKKNNYGLNLYTLSGESIIKKVSRVNPLQYSVPHSIRREDFKTIYETIDNRGYKSVFVLDLASQNVDQWLAKGCLDYAFKQTGSQYFMRVRDSLERWQWYKLSVNSELSKISVEKSLKVDFADEIKFEDEELDVVADMDIVEVAYDSDAKMKWKPAEVHQFEITKKGLVQQTLLGKYDRKYRLTTVKPVSESYIENIKTKGCQIRMFANWETNESPHYFSGKGSRDHVFVLNYATSQSKKGSFVLTEQGKLSIDFDSILGFSANGYHMNLHHFLIGKRTEAGNMKFGVVNAKGRWLLKPIYDSIDFNLNSTANLMIASKGGKHLVFKKETFHQMLNSSGYDAITKLNKWGTLGLMNQNKYGYYYRRTWIEPKFKYAVNNTKTICRLKLVEVMDENHQFLGYADFKGIYYFKEE